MDDDQTKQIADQTEIPVGNLNQNLNKNKNRNKLLIVALFLLMGIAVVIWYFVSKSPGPTDNEKGPLLATVLEEELYKSDVEKIAKEQYLPSAIDDDVVKLFLDIAVEREILDLEAKRLGIEIPPTESKQQYYDMLKKKIIAANVESVDAYVISFWVPPPADYPQKPEYDELRQAGKTALDEAEEKLRNKENPLLVAQILYSKYPVLQPILALNGYLLKSQISEPVFTTPRTYIYDKRNAGQEFYDTLFSLKSGELKKSIWSDGSGGVVIQVINVNSKNGLDYEQWLVGKKKELVNYNTQP